MNALHRSRVPRILAVVLVCALLLAVPMGGRLAAAQDDPFGDTDFTSPKFGTHIEWTSDWDVDRSQSAIEQRRDILVLISQDIDAAVFVELHSQRSFRSADSLLDTFMERFVTSEGFEITRDDSSAYPPSLEFQFETSEGDTFAASVQAQAIEGAMMVAAVLAAPDDLDDAVAAAADGIAVSDIALFSFLPLCGDAQDSATATPDESSSSNSGNSKTGGFEAPASATEASGELAQATETPSDASTDDKSSGFGGRGSENAAAADSGDCVTIATPAPSNTEETPEPTPTTGNTGRGGGLNSEEYASPSFPGVSLQYNKAVWEVNQELSADENNGRDLLQLDSIDLPATLFIETYAGHNGRASACIDLALREAGITPSSDEPIADADGNLIQGSERGRVWGAYAYQTEDLDVGGYVECRALPAGAGVIVITMIAGIDSFPDAYDDLQPILNSIVVG